jgi:inward rectifier potassium channel
MACLERIELPDGRLLRQLVDLPLLRSHNALMGLSWTLTHILEEDSPVLAGLMRKDTFNLIVTVSGLDSLLASQSIGGHSYRREDILIDHEFVDVISDIDGVVHLDLSVFHDTRPLQACSSRLSDWRVWQGGVRLDYSPAVLVGGGHAVASVTIRLQL